MNSILIGVIFLTFWNFSNRFSAEANYLNNFTIIAARQIVKALYTTILSELNKKNKITVHMAEGEGIHFFFLDKLDWAST